MKVKQALIAKIVKSKTKRNKAAPCAGGCRLCGGSCGTGVRSK